MMIKHLLGAGLVLAVGSLARGIPGDINGECHKLTTSTTAPDCTSSCPGGTCADPCTTLTWIAAFCDNQVIACGFESVTKPTQVCRHCPCDETDPDPWNWACSGGSIYRKDYYTFSDCFN